MKKAALAFLGVILLFYVAWAFVGWEFNPAQWTTDARGGYAFISIFIGGFAALITYTHPKG